MFSDLVEQADRAAQDLLGGVPVVYRSEKWGSADLVGIFDDTFLLADRGEAGVATTGPAVFVRLADLPAEPDTEGDQIEVEIGGVEYQVREVKTDGVAGGGALLLLRRPEGA